MSVESKANQGPPHPNRGVEPPHRRRRGHAACLGAPLRGVGADPIGRGFRLYGSADEARARRMSELIASGLSAAQAADEARGAAAAPPPQGALDGDEASRLVDALVRLDEAAAEAILDRVFATLSLNRPAASSCCRRCARSGSAGSAVR